MTSSFSSEGGHTINHPRNATQEKAVVKSGENNLKYTEASFSSWVTERRDGIRVASVSIVFPVPELEEAPPAILTADELMDVINRLQSLHAALATD